jgi:hypothetical protein
MEIKIHATPPVLGNNFDEVERQLRKTLADYDVVVTEDTVPDAKKSATEINALAKTINRRRIDAVKDISAPIKEFDDRGKALEKLCQETRQKILDQVSKFEEKQLEKARYCLKSLLAGKIAQHGLREEFTERLSVEPLVKLSAMTAKGKLTAASGRDVEALVLAAKSIQDRTDRRISEAESTSYRLGLASPLTRAHVESFLFCEEDSAFTQRLASLIDAEKLREEAAVEKARLERERELAAREAEAAADYEAHDEHPAQEPKQEKPATWRDNVSPATRRHDIVPDPMPIPAARSPQVVINVELCVTLPAGVSLDQAKEQLMKKLRAAGIDQSVRSVTAEPVGQEFAA